MNPFWLIFFRWFEATNEVIFHHLMNWMVNRMFWIKGSIYGLLHYLGGGFKHFLFSPFLGEMIQFETNMLQMGSNHHLSIFNYICQVIHAVTLLSLGWRSPTTSRRVTFSPSQEGHQQDCQIIWFLRVFSYRHIGILYTYTGETRYSTRMGHSAISISFLFKVAINLLPKDLSDHPM